MYFNEKMECMKRDELEKLQAQRLVETVRRVYASVPHYRAKMDAEGVKPADIQSLADLTKLPFAVKQDMRENYPYGLFAVPMSDIVRVHASSGTTGKLTVVGYTQKDIDTWAELMARTMVMGGTTKDSVVQNAYGYGLFTGGLGIHYGAEKVGATVVPISGGNTERQVTLLKDFGATVLACTPSYALHIAETIKDMGVDLSELKLKYGVFGAEPWTESMRKEIQSKLNILAIDIYGLSEIMGPGVASECRHQCGLHIFEDHFIPEIIDPKTLQPLPYGEKGELVFTTITKEGIPMIRYRTRDITSLTCEPCACGRTHVRMQKVLGRSDDMLIIRGVNVFPSQIETILCDMGELEPHYLLVVDRIHNMDMLEVWVEVSERMFSDEVRQMEELTERITERIHTMLGISAKVKLVEPRSIPRSEGKAKRVMDKRNLNS